MTGVALGLACAVCIAVGNFTGGLASRKDSSATVSFISQLIGLPIVIALLFVFTPSHVTPHDLAWGVLAGVLQIFALRILWQAMSVGAMGLIGVINAFMAAVVPVAWVVSKGDHIGVVGWIGAAIGVVALLLVGRKPGDITTLVNHRANALAAVAAGTLFGLGYVCLAIPAHAATVAPLLSMRLASTALGGAMLILTDGDMWISDENRKVGFLPGIFGCLSLVGFVIAVHAGVVATTSIVQALAPLAVAALAYVFLKQKLQPVQAFGFALAVGATVLLAIG